MRDKLRKLRQRTEDHLIKQEPAKIERHHEEDDVWEQAETTATMAPIVDATLDPVTSPEDVHHIATAEMGQLSSDDVDTIPFEMDTEFGGFDGGDVKGDPLEFDNKEGWL